MWFNFCTEAKGVAMHSRCCASLKTACRRDSIWSAANLNSEKFKVANVPLVGNAT